MLELRHGGESSLRRSGLRTAVFSSLSLLGFVSSGDLSVVQLTSAIEQVVSLTGDSSVQRKDVSKLQCDPSDRQEHVSEGSLTSSIVKAFDFADI